jgi:peptidoglycan/LPS O-acetylase OafA/YrhL
MRTANSTGPLRRFESLDHWRGVACLLVVVYHSTIVYLASVPAATSGWAHAAAEFTHHFNVGVALFFVISGYCIAAAADNARRKNSSTGEYFIRRIRRIYPPYWIVVAFSIGLFFLFDYGWTHPLLSTEPWAQYRPWWYSASQWAGNLTLTETWRSHLFGGIRGHFPGQAWTLCYEEQFYFVTGMALLFARKRFFETMAVVSLATLATSYAASAMGATVSGFFFDGSWLLFAAGVAAFYRIHYARAWMRVALDAVLLLLIPASLIVRVPIYGAVVGFVFAAALPLLFRFDAPVAASPVLTPLLRCGQMCYSLYLVHQIPVKGVTMLLYRMGVQNATSTLLIATPASVAVSVLLGWGFYRVVERRFLNPKSPTAVPQAQPAVFMKAAV